MPLSLNILVILVYYGGVKLAETKLVIDLLNPDLFIKVNKLSEVSNPIFFNRNNQPTPDGLLSNEIFGITTNERRETFAYINLEEYFIHPLYYKRWCKIDTKVRDCVHGLRNFIINSKGELEENENGKNGIKFLKDNIKDIKWRNDNNSVKRGEIISFLKLKKEQAFMKELIVIPALYRDIQSTGGKTSVGEINSLYSQVIVGVRSLKESKEYGFSLSGANRGRIQELLLSIYDYFGSGTTIAGTDTGGMLPGKLGAIKRTVLGKTTDYGSRNVITAPELKVAHIDDLMVDVYHSAIPLSTVIVNFYPYMMFHVRRFFDNEFGGDYTYQYVDLKTKELKYVKIKDPQINFSDDRLHKEMDRFIHGYSNRLIPIEIPTVEKTSRPVYMRFKGRSMSNKEYQEKLKNEDLDQMPILDRRLTWCDVFYIAAMQFAEGKVTLLTRYPIDSYYNQYPTLTRVASTVEIEPMVINNEFYKFYPKIREEDIGSDTSTMFKDSINTSNAHLKIAGGDYDGDQMSSKGAYLTEANEELEAYMHSKAFFINLAATPIRKSHSEADQVIYQLTSVLPGTKLTENIE